MGQILLHALKLYLRRKIGVFLWFFLVLLFSGVVLEVPDCRNKHLDHYKSVLKLAQFSTSSQNHSNENFLSDKLAVDHIAANKSFHD